MQTSQLDPVSRLIYELSKLPGIGEKTATRLSYYIVKQDENYSRSLAEAVINAKQRTGLCSQCFTFTDVSPCRLCSNPQRDLTTICIVEKPSDVSAIEQSGNFRGTYHVLHGLLSPLDGIGPEELKLRELLDRLAQPRDNAPTTSPVKEIILAMNPSVEGEATVLYLARIFRPFGIRVTRIAHGIPIGGQLEHSDKQTIGKALDNRMEMT